jgi:response regulator RpfG family c-di-GMP phosphodiesterase
MNRLDKARILYVDDESMNLMLFEAILEEKYAVFIAESGSKGLRIIEENPDLCIVLSDMKMPRMNGVEFIRQAAALLPHCYFYILTGFEITPEIQQALDEGLIQKYYRKPCTWNEITTEIERMLKEKNCL